MTHKLLLSVTDPHANNAGPKARTDIEHFLADECEICQLPFDYESKLKKLKYKYWDIPRLFKQRKVDEIYFQYPVYSTVLMDALVASIKQNTTAKLIFIIHDIESLRLFKEQAGYAQKEIEWLNQADGLVVHSQAMQDYLRNQGVTTPMEILGLFDYLNPQPLQGPQPYRRSLCFAGNLMKSQFLSQVDFGGKLPLQVYGPNPLDDLSADVSYEGVYTPEELPQHLTANFGLVWDGSRTDTCDGDFGEYMQYNCPHKVSLYISSGLPVVVWEKAAVAKYLVENGLGIAVASLDELPGRLAQFSLEDYEAMKARVAEVATGLRSGQQIKSALERLHTRLK